MFERMKNLKDVERDEVNKIWKKHLEEMSPEHLSLQKINKVNRS